MTGAYLDLQLVVGLDLLPEGSREGQQTALVHVEAALLVPTHDVEGEGRAVPGRVPVRHHQLQDAAAHGLALLQAKTHLKSPFRSSSPPCCCLLRRRYCWNLQKWLLLQRSD